MMTDRHILVLGLGNVLLQDEGLGVHAVRTLIDRGPWPDSEMLDGGTLGLDLLPLLSGASHLLVLDAVSVHPGHEGVVRLEGAAIPAALTQVASMHQVGLQELLALALFQGTLPEQYVLLGLVPREMRWGTELTSETARALPTLVAAAEAQLRAWGIVPASLTAMPDTRPDSPSA